MARKTKTIKKYYRSKARWSPNISEFSSSEEAQPGIFHFESTLATNPSQTTLGVSQVYTVKNFEINFECDGGGQYIEDLAAYIMFVPQGMTVTAAYNNEHPEYIMAYQFYGSASTDNSESRLGTRRIKTRLSRKLNTGDSVILFIKGLNESNPGTYYTIKLHGLVRWWTKAN